MCKTTPCCCGSAQATSSGLGLLAAIAGSWALISAAAAILTDVIDALAVATACGVVGTAAFCAWRVRVLTQPAPDPAPGPLSTAEQAHALPAPVWLAIEAPRCHPRPASTVACAAELAGRREP